MSSLENSMTGDEEDKTKRVTRLSQPIVWYGRQEEEETEKNKNE